MTDQVETLSQRIIGHRLLSRFFQIDRLMTSLTGRGSQTVPAFYLPHGRYTVFVDADPVRAARSFEIVNDEGERIYDDWRWIPEFIANVPVPLVQKELPRGNYRITIEIAPPTSSWTIQIVLNSMISWEAPPRPWRPPLPAPDPIRLRSGGNPRFHIARTGHYELDLDSRTDAQNMADGILPVAKLDLEAEDGHVGWSSNLGNLAFLGAGNWTIKGEPNTEWELVLKPWIGPKGGGTRGF